MFILCQSENDGSALHCAVYNDFTGEAMSEGIFVDSRTRRFTSVSEADFVAFDGRSILLTRRRRLVRVAAAPRPLAPALPGESSHP